jgi:hypothetical protein
VWSLSPTKIKKEFKEVVFKNLKTVLTSCLLVMCVDAANAIPITFTATNFESVINADPAPQQKTTVSFDYDLDQFGMFILNSFALNIMGKSYGLADITYEGLGGFVLLIGDPKEGLSTLRHGTDDFYLAFNSVNHWNGFMIYTVDGVDGAWNTSDTFAEVRSIPEPSIISMMVLGVTALGLQRRKLLVNS